MMGKKFTLIKKLENWQKSLKINPEKNILMTESNIINNQDLN
jgi:hypothetical protein